MRQKFTVNSYEDELVQRIRRDLDGLECSRLDTSPVQYRESWSQYFRDLFRIQAELVQLQDLVVKTGHEVVIRFEGGDAVGKGCVIKRITRITQRLNPRVC